MRILMTNDDGIFAPGLAALYKELVKIGDVTVVAPADSKSGAGHSITFNQPLVCSKVKVKDLFEGFSVQGSPADCVKLAALKLLDGPIDLLVSGINNGANAGVNVYYSGTVAAAMEGSFLKIPSVAMSLAAEDKMDFETAAKYCVEVLKKLMPVQNGDVININIPPLSMGKPKGVRVVPQAIEGFDEYFTILESSDGSIPATGWWSRIKQRFNICAKKTRPQTIFKLGAGLHREEKRQVDTTSLVEGYITVTALIADMTNHPKTRDLEQIEFDI